MKFIKYILILAILPFLINCGESEKKDDKKSVKIGASKVDKKEDSNSVNIGLTGDDMMQYSTKELKVKAGSEVTLTLRHIGKMDLKVMGHNFVLLKPDVNISAFSLEAANAGEPKNWIPNDGKDIIAHTKMIGGGQSTSITFTAPAAGTYDFICSFPGHSGLMKGKFIVE
jgi:azurin